MLYCGSIPETRCLGNFLFYFIFCWEDRGHKELSKLSCCTVQDVGSYDGCHCTVVCHLCGEVAPLWSDVVSALPPFNPLWRNVKVKNSEEFLGCIAQLYSLLQPQWNSTPPSGTYVGGATLDSWTNFRVMPFHQKTALRKNRVIYKFIMTF